VLLLLCTIPVYSQQYGTGVIQPNPADKKVNSPPALTTPSSPDLPSSVSLKMFCPKPESQGGLGTCVAWATTFYALSITENVLIKRTQPQQITDNVFSPYFTNKYSSNDPTFQKGMTLWDALDFLKYTGAVRRLAMEKTLSWLNINNSLYINSTRYRISGWGRIFDYFDDKIVLTTNQKVLPIKMSLVENKPVIISFKVQPSFFAAKGLWQPVSNQNDMGYTALCVIGYDDNIYGGAFEIVNSWGEDWGNEGFMWISYKDFADYVDQAHF